MRSKGTRFLFAAFASATVAAAAEPVRIHPVGDSITRGFDGEGYRVPLYDLLKAKGVDFHFVGSDETGPRDFPEKRHDGHNGWTASHLIGAIDGWLAANKPDVVLLMIGANDLESGVPVDEVVGRVRTLLDKIATTPARVLLSEITVIRDKRIDDLALAVNAKLKSLTSEAGRRETFVPMHDAFGVDDLRDLDHPKPSGNRKIAERFWRALEPILKRRP